MANARDIIIKPIITEKSMMDSTEKKYHFEVKKGTNKTQVKQAIEEIFGVNVDKVNVMNYKPKTKRLGKFVGKTNSRRKAVVKLTADSKEIVLFEQN